jgi:hypothetical protein
VLTLYTTPVIYLYMEKLSRWVSGAKAPHVQLPGGQLPDGTA